MLVTRTYGPGNQACSARAAAMGNLEGHTRTNAVDFGYCPSPQQRPSAQPCRMTLSTALSMALSMALPHDPQHGPAA